MNPLHGHGRLQAGVAGAVVGGLGAPTVGGRLHTFYYKTNPFMEIISVDGACVSSNFPPPPPPPQPPHSEPDSARAAPPSAAAPPALRNRNRGKDGVNFAYGQENGGRTIAGGCVPIETRTGWDATLPCSCSDESIILNCINNTNTSINPLLTVFKLLTSKFVNRIIVKLMKWFIMINKTYLKYF